MALVLDAGALVAVERGDAAVLGLLLEAERDGVAVRTTSPVVSQVWRDGSRQARLARLLAGVEQIPHDRERARTIGGMCAAAGTSDVVDAGVVEAAATGDDVITSDVDDLASLAAAARRRLTLIRV